MTDSPTSLDRLHDLALPPEVSWWPLAPGWYVALTIALILVLVLAFRTWKRWQLNAYRRAAMRELATMKSAPEIAILLRRAALAIAPRDLVAAKTGPDWLNWLSAQCAEPMPEEVRRQLIGGVYAPPCDQGSISSLREYASHWISRHRVTQFHQSPSDSSSNSRPPHASR